MFRTNTPMLLYGPMRPPSAQRFRRPMVPPSTAETDGSGRTNIVANSPGTAPSSRDSYGSYSLRGDSRPRSSRLHRRRLRHSAAAGSKMTAARFIGVCPTETLLKLATDDFVQQNDPFADTLSDLPKVTQAVVQSHMQPSHRDGDEFGTISKRALPSYYYTDTDKPTKGPRPTSKSLHMQANLEGKSSKETRKTSPKRAQQDSQGVPRLETDSPLCFARKENNLEVFNQSDARPRCVQFACFEPDNDEPSNRANGVYFDRNQESVFPGISVQDFTAVRGTPEVVTRPSWRGRPSSDSQGGVAKGTLRFQTRPPSRPESVPNPGRISSAKATV